jgi:hypothetical protein
MHVCMYVYMFTFRKLVHLVCSYVCMYVCMYTCVRPENFLTLFVRIYVCVHTCLRMYVPAYTYTHTHVQVYRSMLRILVWTYLFQDGSVNMPILGWECVYAHFITGVCTCSFYNGSVDHFVWECKYAHFEVIWVCSFCDGSLNILFFVCSVCIGSLNILFFCMLILWWEFEYTHFEVGLWTFFNEGQECEYAHFCNGTI